jgi:tRNA dimethylallyltransferase
LGNDVIIIAGPTAVGKSAAAAQLARAHHGIIINADSLQIYNALPILTAQPGAIDQHALPHALYGTLPPDILCSVAMWLDLAVPLIRSAWTNDQTPIVVGGTGLYLRALLDGLSPLPPVDEATRTQARALQSELGNPGFHAALAELDPKMAARLNPNDTQRLVRAYEVMRSTGRSLADWQEEAPVPPLPEATFEKILIDAPRPVLRGNAFKRLHQMVEHGVMDEVAGFAARIADSELSPACAPTQALGYFAFADAAAGRIRLDDAIGLAFTQTAQYIKRQQTWFRHQMTFDRIITPDIS